MNQTAVYSRMVFNNRAANTFLNERTGLVQEIEFLTPIAVIERPSRILFPYNTTRREA